MNTKNEFQEIKQKMENLEREININMYENDGKPKKQSKKLQKFADDKKFLFNLTGQLSSKELEQLKVNLLKIMRLYPNNNDNIV